MLSILTIPVTPFQQNARVLFDSVSKRATVVDPGGDVETILAALKQLEVSCEQILLTHAHIDHGGGVQGLRDALAEPPVRVLGHPADRPLRESIARQAELFGLSPSEYQNVPEPDQLLEQGDQVSIDGHVGNVLFTPGHAPGHISVYFPVQTFRIAQWNGRTWSIGEWEELSAPFVVAGDALFAGSIGRTDLPGGSFDTLITSIKQQLLTLPDETVVMSGHGENTRIGVERRENPFLR